MSLSRRTLSMALAITPGIGGKTLTRILTRNDLLSRGPSEFMKLGAEALREEYRLNAKTAQTWATLGSNQIKRAQELEQKLDPMGVKMITAADAAYPSRLEDLDSDPPGAFYVYGNHKLLESKTKCILSSRKTSEKGLQLIDKLAEESVLQGEVLVSGHDTLEYQKAAVVPLRWGAPRVLVLDCGFFKALGEDLSSEPFRTARLWRYQFDSKTDCAVSTIDPDKDFHPNSNRIRDRIVAALSLSLDFVEVRPGGNMEKIALGALKTGRVVRVSEDAECANLLVEQGAKLIFHL